MKARDGIAPTYDAQVFRVPWEGKTFDVAGRQDGLVDFATPELGTYPMTLATVEALIVALAAAAHDVRRALAPQDIA